MNNILYNLCYTFFFFFVASIIGYICEVIFCSITEKKIVLNRGFLIGPYIPIYGIGTITILILLRKYFNDPVALFLFSTITCSLIEYVTSFIMEKLFKIRWWDYSNQKFNIEGRVCLLNSILFGVTGIIVVYFVYPFISNLLHLIPHNILIIISIISFIIFITDFIITTTTLVRVRTSLEEFKGMDATEIARSKVINSTKKHSFLINRLLKAFPHIDKYNNKEIGEFKKLVKNIRETIKKIKKGIEDKTSEFKINKKNNK